MFSENFYRFSHAAAIPEPVTAPAPDSATKKLAEANQVHFLMTNPYY